MWCVNRQSSIWQTYGLKQLLSGLGSEKTRDYWYGSMWSRVSHHHTLRVLLISVVQPISLPRLLFLEVDIAVIWHHATVHLHLLNMSPDCPAQYFHPHRSRRRLIMSVKRFSRVEGDGDVCCVLACSVSPSAGRERAVKVKCCLWLRLGHCIWVPFYWYGTTPVFKHVLIAPCKLHGSRPIFTKVLVRSEGHIFPPPLFHFCICATAFTELCVYDRRWWLQTALSDFNECDFSFSLFRSLKLL